VGASAGAGVLVAVVIVIVSSDLRPSPILASFAGPQYLLFPLHIFSAVLSVAATPMCPAQRMIVGDCVQTDDSSFHVSPSSNLSARKVPVYAFDQCVVFIAYAIRFFTGSCMQRTRRVKPN
jgi:hypothetical protein